ncbi:hypothetical protein SEA_DUMPSTERDUDE_14 [Gordonia phage DumpsterDude]|uniref:Uncharacterized protein n=1 Tax=Gordonia phage DumpsterDude TaxID=2713262 RepID=A0A6G8R086_9CAUD|nr:hypothetical protein JZX77_gp14 [Gordonia phage DumpsterDude]QIN93602.1 hypothetical protein SEA_DUMPSTERDUDE_14 [Gordonia phage DumpsterDude]
MIEIEFTTDHGDHAEGDTLRVDRLSAQVLVEDRKVAKVVEEVETPDVESGGERARELNQAAADAAEKAAADAAVDSAPTDAQGDATTTAAGAPTEPSTDDGAGPAPVEKTAPAPKGGRK